jgi:long-chain acyl-CoA synthetase
MLPNVPYFGLVYYGILRAGAIAVPLCVLLKSGEVAYALGDAEAKLVLAWHAFAEAAPGAEESGSELVPVVPGEFDALLHDVEPARPIAPVKPDTTAVILYTSGTTGRPKGAELTHRSLKLNAEYTARKLLEITPEDVLLGALPLFHSFGQTCAMNASVATGSCLTLLPRFDPAKALSLIERDRVTVFEGVPTMYVSLLRHPDRERFDTSALRRCVSGGASIPVEVLRAFEAAFDVQVLEGYGLSETSPVASFNHPDRPQKEGSIGTPIGGVDMRAVDPQGEEVVAGEVGEIVIRGHNLMKGYWRREDATREAMRGGWFHTGDLAREDDDGYFFIVDRVKDMILRGGFNVYPREIEEVLYAHPAVAEAAVVGIPDPLLGEEVGAAVVVKPGHELDADELAAYVKARVASFKYPRRVWFVDELPKGPTGKLLKREIAVPEPPSAVAVMG